MEDTTSRTATGFGAAQDPQSPQEMFKSSRSLRTRIEGSEDSSESAPAAGRRSAGVTTQTSGSSAPARARVDESAGQSEPSSAGGASRPGAARPSTSSGRGTRIAAAAGAAAVALAGIIYFVIR